MTLLKFATVSTYQISTAPLPSVRGWIDADSAKYCNDDDTCVRVRGEGVGWLSQCDEDERGQGRIPRGLPYACWLKVRGLNFKKIDHPVDFQSMAK